MFLFLFLYFYDANILFNAMFLCRYLKVIRTTLADRSASAMLTRCRWFYAAFCAIPYHLCHRCPVNGSYLAVLNQHGPTFETSTVLLATVPLSRHRHLFSIAHSPLHIAVIHHFLAHTKQHDFFLSLQFRLKRLLLLAPPAPGRETSSSPGGTSLHLHHPGPTSSTSRIPAPMLLTGSTAVRQSALCLTNHFYVQQDRLMLMLMVDLSPLGTLFQNQYGTIWQKQNQKWFLASEHFSTNS